MKRRVPDWRVTLAAIVRLAEPGTVQIHGGGFGWAARAVLRGQVLESWTCWYCAKTFGASLRTLLRELQKERAALESKSRARRKVGER